MFTLSQDPVRHLDPSTVHSLSYVLALSILGSVVAVAFALAVSYPVTALGTVLLAVASWLAFRTVHHFYRTRRRNGWTRRACVPKSNVCVEL